MFKDFLSQVLNNHLIDMQRKSCNIIIFCRKSCHKIYINILTFKKMHTTTSLTDTLKLFNEISQVLKELNL